VVAPGTGFVRKKGPLIGERHGFDQPLGILMQARNRLFFGVGQQPNPLG